MEPQDVQAYLEDHQDRAVEELKDWLRIPSVSADSAFREDCLRAARFVHEQLESCGLATETVETDGLPVIYAEWTQAAGAPTAIIYGHYDVQPPDPLEDWITPAFEPTVRDGCLYARGATDDKGQLFTHIKAIQAWLQVHGRLPVNVRFVIEGEEEVGSDNLDRFLEERREQLQCDICVVSDTAQYGDGIPAITYGLRGNVFLEAILKGPRQDLHSGVFGGAVANPSNAMARLIAKMHDDEGRVLIPGFYDDVVELTDEEREQFANLPFEEASFCRSLGIDAVFGEPGYTTLERRWARPTFDVNGIISGYTGEGPKSIVPASARCKFGCRLVPNQDPQRIETSLKQFMQDNCPPGLTLEFLDGHRGRPSLCDTSSPFMAAAREAIEAGFGEQPVMIREGGSIPVVASFKELLGVDTLLLGWGRNSDNLHSPNEHFHLDDFHHGTRASAHLWAAMSDI